TEHEDVAAFAPAGGNDSLDEACSLFQGHGALRSDGSFGGEPSVGDEDVRSGLRHLASLLLIEYIRAGQKADIVSARDHLDLFAVAHPRFFEVHAEHSIDQPHRWEVLDTRKTH